ncbi:MAG: hypothetical protein GY938_24490 [Ketobacter sp.]|nr:hypothetical protein [Ketobacter sp.]
MSKKNNAGTTALINMINTLIEEKTFSGEAITAIASLREHAKSAEEEVMGLSVHIEDLKREKSKIFEENTNSLRQIIKLKEMNDDLFKEVTETRALHTKMLVAEAKAATYENCFDKVFRNMQVHRKVTSIVPTPEQHTDAMGQVFTTIYPYQTTEEVAEEHK